MSKQKPDIPACKVSGLYSPLPDADRVNLSELVDLELSGVNACMQHAFGLAWSASQSRSPFMRAVPTLEAIALRRGGIPNVLLAAGAGSAAILSEHGHQLDNIRFPVRPCT
jgi:hypothetical protein